MQIRNSRNPEAPSIRRRRSADFGICAAAFILFLTAGCGAPAEPTPPSPPVPVAVIDLAAQQVGEAVQLTFTMPAKTISGDRLRDTPAVEILRGALKSDGTPDAKSFRVIETIPGALVGDYRVADKVQLSSRISPEELHGYPGRALAYRIHTRASRKRASADSNTVMVRIRAVPERIASVSANVTESTIELSWTAPQRTSDGAPTPAISEFRVYRGEIDAASSSVAVNDLSQAKWKSPLALLGSSKGSNYRDSTFDFAKTYLYSVRTVMQEDGSAVESSDSVPTVVTPRDVFPPNMPQGVVAAVIVGSPTNAFEVDLSWSINIEPDLAGYRVYRSEQQDTPGQLVTPDLLLSPAYRDTSVQPGHRYWYSVSGVDRSGNESAPSAPVAVEVAQPSS